MKVFIVGDHKTGTGPANVTKEYIRCFPKGTKYQKMTSKAGRVPELVWKVLFSDVILFSGYSAQNVLGMKLAKMFHKKTAYLVHGAITHENAINGADNQVQSSVEEETLMRADLLLAVSEKFAGWMRKNYPQYEGKIDFVTNGVDFDYLKTISNGIEKNIIRNKKEILSVGGGMPRKMIIYICRALEIINEKRSKDEWITLSVIGAEGKDTDEIKSCQYVNYLGMVSADKKEELYRQAAIFIQNSCFETFGLAVFEALMSGCSVLTSKVAGALDLLPEALDSDIINEYNNPQEIADKILNLIDNPNCDRLKESIDEEKATWEYRTQELIGKLQVLVNG